MAKHGGSHRAVLPQRLVVAGRPYPLETMHAFTAWQRVQPERWRDGRCSVRNRPMRLFARLSLDSALPDRTTIMNFRHLLEQHQLAANCSRPSIAGWPEAGVMMTQGTLVDATIIEGSQLDQEQRAATRSGDASDQRKAISGTLA